MRGKRSHRGKRRIFTDPEEIARQMELTNETTVASTSGDGDADSSSTDTEEEGEEKEVRHKGISHLIEVCNPNANGAADNRPSRKEVAVAAKSVAEASGVQSETELTAELARLALIRKQREEAALKREAEKKAREADRQNAALRAQAKLAAINQKTQPGRRRGASAAAARTSSKSSKSAEAAPSTSSG